VKPHIENTRGLNWVVVKLTTIQVTKLPLYHKIHKIGMICSGKPVLIQDLYVVQKEDFSITCCMCEMCTWQNAEHIHNRRTHLLVREDVT
jgi:hypothetical protein